VIAEKPSKQTRDFVDELVCRKMFIDHDGVDAEELNIARAKALQMLNRPTILYLMLAQGCNFECTYCPIPGLAKRYGNNLLSFDDAIAGIELWQRHINDYPADSDPYFLIFYGGEPLLNKEVLEKLLGHVEKAKDQGDLPQNLELMLCTNGALLDARLAKLFTYHKVTVALGIDGPPQDNNRIRLTGEGMPTFSLIKRAVDFCLQEGVRVVASATITPSNLQCLQEYPAFMKNLGISQFGFNLMKGSALIRELAGKSAEEYCLLAAKNVLAGLKDVTEEGQYYEYQLQKKLSMLTGGLPFSVDCTCYGNQLVIQADGQVTNCPFLRCDQGHVNDLPESFRIGETGTVHEWRQRLPLFNGEASEVFNGGGCAWGSHEIHSSINSPDLHNAIFTKEVVHGLIWSFLSEEQATALLRGDAYYWCHRRIGSMQTL